MEEGEKLPLFTRLSKSPAFRSLMLFSAFRAVYGMGILVVTYFIATSDNGQLFSEELHWSNRDDRLYSPVACSIVRGESVVNGANAAARPNLEVIEMKEVTATLYEKDEKLNESE